MIKKGKNTDDFLMSMTIRIKAFFKKSINGIFLNNWIVEQNVNLGFLYKFSSEN